MYRTLFALLLVALPLRAEVPQFRGAGNTGVSDEKNLPITWSDKENVRWKVALPGKGLSSPVVGGNRVFVTACSGATQNRLHVLCFDLKTGKQLWERQLWATGTTQCHPKTNMAAPTPCTDGERVYALFATADTVCYDKDGHLIWYRSLTGDYPTIGNNIGMAASPILFNDLFIATVENVGDSFAIGLDKLTGQNRWRVARPRGINWTTPLVVAGEVMFSHPEGLAAHDASSGQKKWELTGKPLARMASLTSNGSLLFAPGDKFLAIKPGEKEAKVVWESGKLPSSYSSPTFYKDRVYTLNFRGVLNCADAKTGEVLWTERLNGEFSSSPLIADGKIYAVAEDGSTTVLEAGDTAKVIANNSLGDKFLANPIAAGGSILLRSDNWLYAIGKN